MTKEKCEQIIDLNYYNHDQSNRVYGGNGLSPTIRTGEDDAKGIKVAIKTEEYFGVYDHKESNTFRPTIDKRVHKNYPISKTLTCRDDSCTIMLQPVRGGVI